MKWIRILFGLMLLGIAAFSRFALREAETRAERGVSAARSEVAVVRDNAAALRQALARQQELAAQWEALSVRLLSDNPFADMEWALEQAAAAAGVQLESIRLTGAAEVEGLPRLVRYDAEVTVSATYLQFVAFLRQLEGHKLLLAIPDLDLTLGESADAPFTVTFVVGFFAEARQP